MYIQTYIKAYIHTYIHTFITYIHTYIHTSSWKLVARLNSSKCVDKTCFGYQVVFLENVQLFHWLCLDVS